MNLRRTRNRSTVFAMLLASIGLSLVTSASAADAETLPASAADVKPLTSGDQAPAFTVRTVDNEIYQFDPNNLAKPTILISFRGGWCPYCNLHLSELRNVIPEINALGVDVLFLSGDRPDQLYSSLQADTQEDIDGRDYVILSDADINAARAFGTAFLVGSGVTNHLSQKGRDYSGSSIGQHNALAVPAVYVIGKNGEIVFDFVNADYKVRLPADELLAAAKNAAD